MNVILFGGSGMVGQGVLRECLLDPQVESVLAVSRRPLGKSDSKLHELVQADVGNLAGVEDRLRGFDACFFCLGVSSVGMNQEDYRQVTYELPLGIARTLVKLNPEMTFLHVTGAGTDSAGTGRRMWARVKGRVEKELLKMPFKAAYMFRPGAIEALDGIESKTRLYRWLYVFFRPLFTVLRWISPDLVTTTRQIGRAMILVAQRGWPSPILESGDINAVH